MTSHNKANHRNNHQSVPDIPSTLSPFRYPGGKSGLRSRIIGWMKNLGFRPQHFLEPFAGGSSVGLAVAELDLADHVTLVELDPDVAAVWKVILGGKADSFAGRIRKFTLTRNSARKALQSTDSDLLSRAFRCLLLNRISRGGIIAPGAGWLKRGEHDKGIRSRWYPDTLAKRIESIHALRKKITFVEGDGLQILRDFSSASRTVAFVDPPYVVKGRGAGLRLYRHHNVDCEDLFEIAQGFSGPMVITYHRSEIVWREAIAAGIKCHTVNMHTAHSASKRQLILYKSGFNGAISAARSVARGKARADGCRPS